MPQQLLASGASTALFIVLIILTSALLGLLGAIVSLLGRTIVGFFVGDPDWISALSKRNHGADH